MIIYRYDFSFLKPQFEKTEIEVIEKPKTYIYKDTNFKHRVNKCDIGKPTGYNNRTVYLTEDNDKKAIRVYLSSFSTKIKGLKGIIENSQNEIERLKGIYNTFLEVVK